MLSRLLSVLAVLCGALYTSALSLNGADFSSLSLLESQGIHYTTNGQQQPFETILERNGFKLARIRVWTAGTYTQSYALNLARRAKNAGMKVLIDLHYSDTWADPGHQSTPSGWPNTLSGLNTQIYTYTMNLVSSFQSQGVPIDYIQVGNEINNGLLWPTGEISVNGYHAASELLHSAVAGVRAASSTTKTVIHIANGWDTSSVNAFFNGIFVAGALSTSDVDAFGFSFYPFYGTGATFSALQTTLNGMVQKYNKDIFIAETNWPFSCSSSVALSATNIPKSTAGQQTWTKDVENVLSSLPNGHGLGVIYWEPGWIGNANLGSSCSDNLLVDSSGATRSSISLF